MRDHPDVVAWIRDSYAAGKAMVRAEQPEAESAELSERLARLEALIEQGRTGEALRLLTSIREQAATADPRAARRVPPPRH